MYILEGTSSQNKVFLDDTNDKSKFHITWEIESKCSLACKYCYSNRTKIGSASLSRIDDLTREINDSEITNVHLTGGEPTLSPYLEHIVSRLANKKIFITTNLIGGLGNIKHLISRYRIYSVAVSLDSVDEQINDFLRGRTSEVMAGICELINFKRENGIGTKIRIHCVISRVNLPHIGALLEWAKSIGVDEVSCQPVSIEPWHEHYNALCLKYDDFSAIRENLGKERELFDSRYATSHARLIEFCLKNEGCFIKKSRELCSKFIDACGRIWSCPMKLQELPHIDTRPDGGECKISTQCMTCLKHLTMPDGSGTNQP